MNNMEEMIMDKKKERKLILETVMELKRPFSLSFLFMSLKEKGVNDKTFILEVLDYLCETGWVRYSEIIDDCWAYEFVGRKIS